jgi:hypothetical protein
MYFTNLSARLASKILKRTLYFTDEASLAFCNSLKNVLNLDWLPRLFLQLANYRVMYVQYVLFAKLGTRSNEARSVKRFIASISLPNASLLHCFPKFASDALTL